MAGVVNIELNKGELFCVGAALCRASAITAMLAQKVQARTPEALPHFADWLVMGLLDAQIGRRMRKSLHRKGNRWTVSFPLPRGDAMHVLSRIEVWLGTAHRDQREQDFVYNNMLSAARNFRSALYPRKGRRITLSQIVQAGAGLTDRRAEKRARKAVAEIRREFAELRALRQPESLLTNLKTSEQTVP